MLLLSRAHAYLVDAFVALADELLLFFPSFFCMPPNGGPSAFGKERSKWRRAAWTVRRILHQGSSRNLRLADVAILWCLSDPQQLLVCWPLASSLSAEGTPAPPSR
jgi:hypothetical protein